MLILEAGAFSAEIIFGKKIWRMRYAGICSREKIDFLRKGAS